MSYPGLLYPTDEKYLKEVVERGYFILVDRNAKNISTIAGGQINDALKENNELLFIFGKHIAGTRQDIIDALYLSGLDIFDINKVISFGINIQNVNARECQEWICFFHQQNIAPVSLRLKLNTTTVVSVKVNDIRPKYKDLEQWMNDFDNVYIGRKGIVFIERKYRYPKEDSIWANPFKIHGDMSRETVINMYRDHILAKLNSGEISHEQLLQLKGKTLGCWCKENGQNIPCHGDVLVELLNQFPA